jgi:preprotein translocase subunit YajC
MFELGAAFDLTIWHGNLLLAQKAAPGGSGIGLINYLPFLVIGLLFYFMFIRPDRQRRAEQAEMLDNLKKNDRVVTAGGIYGTIVNANKGDKDVVIRVDENSNTRLRVVRTSISRVVTESDSESTSA